MKVHYDFSGHTLVVAGAASGIGNATALAFLEAGATVIAVDIDADGLARVAHARWLPRRVDIADSAAVQVLVDEVLRLQGRIDGAVLTSAIQHRSLIEETSDEAWQRHLDVNLSGIFYFLRALFPVMKDEIGRAHV